MEGDVSPVGRVRSPARERKNFLVYCDARSRNLSQRCEHSWKLRGVAAEATAGAGERSKAAPACPAAAARTAATDCPSQASVEGGGGAT